MLSKDVVARIGAMDASARLLVGSIAIILVMGLFLVSQYAASPTMAGHPGQSGGQGGRDPDHRRPRVRGRGQERADLVHVRPPRIGRDRGAHAENAWYVAAADQDDPLPEQGSMMSQARRKSPPTRRSANREVDPHDPALPRRREVNIVFNPGDRTWRRHHGRRDDRRPRRRGHPQGRHPLRPGHGGAGRRLVAANAPRHRSPARDRRRCPELLELRLRRGGGRGAVATTST